MVKVLIVSGCLYKSQLGSKSHFWFFICFWDIYKFVSYQPTIQLQNWKSVKSPFSWIWNLWSFYLWLLCPCVDIVDLKLFQDKFGFDYGFSKLTIFVDFSLVFYDVLFCFLVYLGFCIFSVYCKKVSITCFSFNLINITISMVLLFISLLSQI